MENKFCSILLKLRKEKSILQKDIAKLLDVSTRQYQRYEKGDQEPSLDKLIEIANIFDVSLDYLTGTGLYSKEEMILTHKDTIILYLNELYDTDFFSKVSAWADDDFMRALAFVVKDVSFSGNDDDLEITLSTTISPEAGRNLFKTLV